MGLRRLSIGILIAALPIALAAVRAGAQEPPSVSDAVGDTPLAAIGDAVADRPVGPVTVAARPVPAPELSDSQDEMAAIWGTAGEARSREMQIEVATRMAPVDLWFGVP